LTDLSYVCFIASLFNPTKKREIRRHHNWEAEGGNANGSSQEQQSLLEFYSQNPPLTTASN